jgi:hypothetical protein
MSVRYNQEALLPKNTGDACSYNLGDDGLAYVRDRLADGGSIAHEILTTCKLESPSTVFTCGLGPDALRQLSTGRGWQKGRVFWRQWIEHYLQSAPSGLAIAAEVHFRVGSPIVEKRRSHVMVFDEEVYYFSDGTPGASVDRMLGYRSLWPSHLFLCERGREFARPGRITASELLALCENLRWVLVDAYDDETFIAVRCAEKHARGEGKEPSR